MRKKAHRPASGVQAPAGVRMASICAATDFSETAQFALNYAVLFAEQFHASLHVLHVLHELGPSVPSVDYMACCEMAHDYFAASEPPHAADEAEHQDPARRFLQCLERQTRNRLQSLIASSPLAGMPVTAAIRYGHPVEEICRYASENSVDLIVLGARGRTGIDYFMMGSVAERVVRVSPCAVLTIRLPKPMTMRPDGDVPAAETTFQQFSTTRS